LKPHFIYRLVLLAFPLLGLLLTSSTAAQQDDLPQVLHRAAQYVEQYEEHELGSLLATENYLQNATSYSADGRGLVLGRQQSRTQSDFLILILGPERIGLRIVKRLNGAAVKSTVDSFESMMDASPLGMRQSIKAIQDESSRYNIGGVLRKINVPTFALRVAREAEGDRISFKKSGTDKISGIETWEIKFQEKRSPTLVHGELGESLLSSGSLWIEPGTGRIVKTELKVENPLSKPPVKGRIVVTYAVNKALGILVPTQMTENYETVESVVNCIASYSDFRSFKVDASSVIGPVVTDR
jgi:hypothetical protein